MFNALMRRFRGEPTPAADAPPRAQYILYTRGAEVVRAQDYRQSFDTQLMRALGGQAQLGDSTLSRAFGVSATAFACADKSANISAGFPLHIAGPDGKPLEESPFTYFLEHQAANTLKYVALALQLWGRFYLRKLYNPYGWPSGLAWLNPVDVIEYPDSAGNVLFYDVYNGWGRYDRIPAEQMVTGHEFDSTGASAQYPGLSRFEVAWKQLGLDLGATTWAAAFFTNNAAIDGFLSFDEEIDEERDLPAIREEWEKNFKGARNAHRTAVMPKGARWNPISAAPKDIALRDTREVNREDICAIFGIHPALIGLSGAADSLSANSTYSAMEVSHIRQTALPRVLQIILPALNNQWARRDFDRADYYRLDVDENSIPALAEANLSRQQTTSGLLADTTLDFPEARKVLGYGERSDYPLKRNPTHAIAVWNAGGCTWNEYQQMLYGGPKRTDVAGEIVNIGGQLVPKFRLMEVAGRMADNLGKPPASQFTFNGGTSTPPPTGGLAISKPPTPLLPPPPPALPAGPVEEPRADGVETMVALDLANHPDLIALQNRVRALMGEQAIEWNAPDSFHVTLVYVPSADPLQQQAIANVLEALEPPALTLRVGSLKSFDTVGQHAIHFRIRQNEALRAFQQQLYAALQRAGVPMSAYSQPAVYTPHITMGYAVEKPKAVTFTGSLAVQPASLICMAGDECVYDSRDGADEPPVDDEPVVRSALAPLEVAVSFAANAFVRAARRTLGEALPPDAVADWVPENDWRVTLCAVDDWTPAAVARFIREADYSGTRRLDLRATSFVLEGSSVSLALRSDGTLDALRTSLALDLNDVGTLSTPSTVTIPLCTLAPGAQVDVAAIPVEAYPLLGANVTLLRGGRPDYQWTLRQVADAGAVRELANWQKKVRSKGPDYPFAVEQIPDDVAAFVTDALIEAVPEEDAFAIGLDMLRGAILWRAYADTRADFVREVTEALTAGQASEIDRRNFAARMRVALRRQGLVAFRDGMNEVGYDPESFSTEELASFREWQAEQSGYVTALGKEMFGQGITPEEVAIRAQMWADMSLEDIRQRGILLGKPNQLMMWVEGDTVQKCEDCLRLHGQVHTMKAWVQSGWTPTSRKTKCHSYQCKCRLMPTDQPEQGEF